MERQTQYYGFTIEHKKPANLFGPDASSRIYEKEKQSIKLERGEKIQNGKTKKHAIKENNKSF